MADTLTVATAPEPRARQRRVGAAFGIAVVSTLVAGIAHTTAGGAWPNAATLVIALLGSTFLTLPVVGAQVRTWRLALAVGVDQLVFHALFATIGSAGAVESAGHAHHAALPLLQVGTSGEVIGAGMGAHHTIAASVSFALLRGGWWLVLAALRAGAALLLRRFAGLRLVPVRRHPGVITTTAAAVLKLDVLRHPGQRRGPPVVVALG